MVKYSLAESSWGQEELDAIQNVIKSNRYSMGPYVKKFEEEFTKFFGSKFAIMVNSGSSANLLAVSSLFYQKNNLLKRGDEVIVPAVSWSTTYSPLYQYGLKVKFVDINLETLNFDIEALESAITENTRMIFAVNLLGNSNEYDKIQKMINGRNIILIEDNCESMGATHQGKFTGTFGEMGTFSTFFSHHISTMEGGMIVTDNQELYHIMLSTRSHGWTRTLPKNNLVTGTKSAIEFEESFKFVLPPGYNLRPLEMSGAVGLEQLKKLPDFITNRRNNYSLAKKELGTKPFMKMQKEIGESSCFGFSFLIDSNAPFTRLELVNFLETNGIDCRPIVAGNFTKKDALKYFDYEIAGDLKNADKVDSHGFFVGNHHFSINEQIHWLSNRLDEFMKPFTKQNSE